jgi:hypothetical protein
MEKVVIRKIELKALIEALVNTYDSGVDYIDFVGIQGKVQDTLAIQFGRDYMNPEHVSKWDELMGDEEDKEIKNIDLSGEDLNQLI